MNQPESSSSDELLNSLRAYIRRQDKLLEALRGYEGVSEHPVDQPTAALQNDQLNDLVRELEIIDEEVRSLTQLLSANQTELRNAQIYLQSLEQALSAKDEAYHQLSTRFGELDAEAAVFRNSRLIKGLVKPYWALRRQLRQLTAATPPTNVTAEAASVLAAIPSGELLPNNAVPLHFAPGATIIFTIISKNYLASARVLMRSIQQFHADIPLVVVLVDEVDDSFDPALEPFQIILASDLDIPNWAHFSMKYDIMELNTAVKPYAIRLMMERYDVQKVIYFDPDICVYHDLNQLLELLDRYLCVLTPHITHSVRDDYSPGELDFLRVGTFNLGFFALSKRGDWKKLLLWWESKLYADCTREVERGLFVDQHWMDLAPSLFDLVYILRDPGYNVAYWNIAGRDLQVDPAGNYSVNGKPLVFFHYSGFSVENPELVSRHQNRFEFADLSAVYQLIFLEYQQLLLDAGYEQATHFPYAYGKFGDDVPIPDALRICLRAYDPMGSTWANPYNLSSPSAFRRWATFPGMVPPFKYVSPLAFTLYKMRVDLQRAFPDVAGKDELAYAIWFVHQTYPTGNFHPVYIEPVRQVLNTTSEETTPVSPVRVSQESAPMSRFASTLHFYRKFPVEVKPYLPPEAFLNPPEVFTGPNNLYGDVRALLYRAGVLQIVRRTVGLRLIMTARHFSSYKMDAISRAAQIDAALLNIQPAQMPDTSLDATEPEPVFSPGVQVIGYLRAETGVGQIARNLLTSIQTIGFPSSGFLLDVRDTYRQEDFTHADIENHQKYLIQVFNVNADQAVITNRMLGNSFYRGHYNIGYWFWELSQFPEQWNDAFDLYDEIWVATHFVREALQKNTTKPVTRVPVSIEVPLPATSNRSKFGLPEDSFLVLVMFDALSVIERKNPWGAIRAFARAFDETERGKRAHLVIKVSNLDKAPEADRLRDAVKQVNGILIDQYLDRLEVNALISHCDAYLSLHRSEGYGLAMAEAMYLGKPVIATAYSGNVDFMTEDNSYLVPYKLVELNRAHPPYEAQNVWANPDVDAAATMLREVFDSPEQAKHKGALAARYIREHYSNQTVGLQIARLLNDILIAQGYDPVTLEAYTSE